MSSVRGPADGASVNAASGDRFGSGVTRLNCRAIDRLTDILSYRGCESGQRSGKIPPAGNVRKNQK